MVFSCSIVWFVWFLGFGRVREGRELFRDGVVESERFVYIARFAVVRGFVGFGVGGV